MRIIPVSSYSYNVNKHYCPKTKVATSERNLLNYNPISNITFGAVKQPKSFEMAYGMETLRDMTSSSRYTPFKLLDIDSEAYSSLHAGDKEALYHLVKASIIFDDVQKRLDNIHNKDFEEFLKYRISCGDDQAYLSKILYDGQKGIFGNTLAGEKVALVKGMDDCLGKGFYPEDLSVEEFHNIIKSMILDGEIEEVRNILNQRSVVVRDGNKLKAIDYTDFFKKEFTEAANEIEEAAKTSTDKDFNEFLVNQAKALRENNPALDALADKKWATLQYTPLEFTIGRECYEDRLTPTIAANPELKQLLDNYNIPIYSKDSLGVRVGIVDKKGTAYLLKIKEFLPFMAENMPFNDKYEQVITKDIKQTMVDSDIVSMTGDFGAYRGGISIASNLPNSDKLAIQTGGGCRNVYHKQFRNAKYASGMKEKLEALLSEPFHKYFKVDALHDFTILHENVHSLGPKGDLGKLGVYKNIIEEHKADTGAFVMAAKLAEKGFYSQDRVNEIITSYITAYVLKGPFYSDAHAHRQIMQFNYFIKNGAITFDSNGKMEMDFAKVLKCSEEMLKNAIAIQLSQSVEKAEKYIKENDQWTQQLDSLAKRLNKVDKRTNSFVLAPLANDILRKGVKFL